MMQLKATCKACEGTGYNILDVTTLCSVCNGNGVLILTGEQWDMELEQVPNSMMKYVEKVTGVMI